MDGCDGAGVEMKMYRSALVLGYGRSGRAAEALLLSEGCSVVVATEDDIDLGRLMEILVKASFDICIVSPGFPFSHSWLDVVRDAAVPLLSELELGWSRFVGKTVAVTGSNGKSSAVKWICEMLQASGQRAEIGGNYGVPASEVVLKNPSLDFLVLEVSSFQLELVDQFSPDIAVLLNILPNHLDRHGSMEVYQHLKQRIVDGSSVAIVPYSLFPAMNVAQKWDVKTWITFGENSAADYVYKEGAVLHHNVEVMNLLDTPFGSPVLGASTAVAVAAVAQACGVSYEMAYLSAKNFQSLPHRLQRLGTIDGVIYANDSKATNLAAVSAALQACGRNVHLVVGGIVKETDFTFIEEVLAERVRSIYLIGRSSSVLYKAWEKTCSCVECGTLEVAFATAKENAKPNDVILLSPGCASFDQFKSFEDRGACFMALFQEAKNDGPLFDEPLVEGLI